MWPGWTRRARDGEVSSARRSPALPPNWPMIYHPGPAWSVALDSGEPTHIEVDRVARWSAQPSSRFGRIVRTFCLRRADNREPLAHKPCTQGVATGGSMATWQPLRHGGDVPRVDTVRPVTNRRRARSSGSVSR
jgi:hypothetical protein